MWKFFSTERVVILRVIDLLIWKYYLGKIILRINIYRVFSI